MLSVALSLNLKTVIQRICRLDYCFFARLALPTTIFLLGSRRDSGVRTFLPSFVRQKDWRKRSDHLVYSGAYIMYTKNREKSSQKGNVYTHMAVFRNSYSKLLPINRFPIPYFVPRDMLIF